ncbi:MAG TPA: ABC transporter substrate-binding protein [Chloroflexota bacterium]|nr:ABC transporter substrate-binding protein [Chloroflexota bacterium]
MGGPLGTRSLSRRRFVQGASAAGLGLLVGCASPLPLGIRQSARVPVVGYLVFGSAESTRTLFDSFDKGLREYGWVDGENITVVRRFGDGDVERVGTLAADLVGLPVDVLVAHAVATPLARRVTDQIPIVMVGGVDPVAQGLVASLAHPGGNVTGLSILERQLTAKRLELLHEGVPSMNRVAVVWSGTNSTVAMAFQDAQMAGSALHVEVQSVGLRTQDQLESVLDTIAESGAQGICVLSDSQMRVPTGRIARGALQRGLPTMLTDGQGIQPGGFMAYGPNLPATFRRAAYYVDRILKGDKPADLPVEQPTTFDFVINLKTAQALGLTIPQHVLLQATEIIQ